MRTWRALYGNVALVRGVCGVCGSTSLVRGGVTVCCEAVVEAPTRVVRECLASGARRGPSKRERAACMAAQGFACFYCRRKFGTTLYRDGKPIVLRAEWDHMVPYGLTQDNRDVNFAAACHVCNRQKAGRVFETLDEIRHYLAIALEVHGYSTVPPMFTAV